jgi:hypothetical protein
MMTMIRPQRCRLQEDWDDLLEILRHLLESRREAFIQNRWKFGEICWTFRCFLHPQVGSENAFHNLGKRVDNNHLELDGGGGRTTG